MNRLSSTRVASLRPRWAASPLLSAAIPAPVLSIDSFGLTSGPVWKVKRGYNHSVVVPRIGLVVAPTNRALDYRNSAGVGRTARTFWAAKLAHRLPMKTKGGNSLLG